MSEDAELAGKHVFIDFYMKKCYYCWEFQADWNRIVDEVTSTYGADKVEFLKIDGPQFNEISQRYGVTHFPSFFYFAPNSRGMKAVEYNGDISYRAMLRWMTRILN